MDRWQQFFLVLARRVHQRDERSAASGARADGPRESQASGRRGACAKWLKETHDLRAALDEHAIVEGTRWTASLARWPCGATITAGAMGPEADLPRMSPWAWVEGCTAGLAWLMCRAGALEPYEEASQSLEAYCGPDDRGAADSTPDSAAGVRKKRNCPQK